jgi:hypothetical protein
VAQDVVKNNEVLINVKRIEIQEDVDPSIKWLERFLKANKEIRLVFVLNISP